VQRHHEIANFVPKDSWELRTTYRNTTFTSTLERFEKEEDCNAVANRIAMSPFTITDITEKKGRESPPRLFDLTSLQVECNKRWGWTADETLQLIQSLYEKKVTTYPRVDTTFLSEDIYPKIGTIMRQMTPYADKTAPVLADKIIKPKRIFDNAKVTDHHAIIPTGQAPNALVGNERQLYHLIAMRFIAAFYPDCNFTQTTVMGRADDVDFKTSGKVITSPGWRALYANEQAQDNDKSDDDDKILPDFVKGESGPHTPSTAKKTTQPPKYYTEGTLLRAMESAGKTVEDEELRDAMKENGIGRPSTRSAIIETLFKRRYIYRERKNIMASSAGIELIATINEELLKSAKLTGLWENKLRRIERGEYSAAEFIQELKELINHIVLNVLNDNSMRRIVVEEDKPATKKKGAKSADGEDKPKKPRRKPIKSFEQVPCPVCGQGHILKGNTAYGCSRFREGCTLRLPFDQYPADLTPSKLANKLSKQ
jgi:DNA topoisomerase-3